MRQVHSILALLLAFAAAPGAHAQAIDGVLDSSFAGAGQSVIAFDRGGGSSDSARALLVDATDRIYMVGDVDTANGRRIGLIRLLSTGAADVTYGNEMSGRVVAPVGGASINVTSAAFDNQGYLLVAGSRVQNATDTAFLVCRFDPQGALAVFTGGQNPCVEVDFDAGGLNADAATSVLVQPDGKIVLAGRAETASGKTMAFARLLPDGSLDPDFGTGGKTTYTGATFVSFAAASIHRLADGSMIVAGDAYDANVFHFGMLVHLGADGQIDAAFSGGHGYARSASLNTEYTDVAYDPIWGQFITIGNVAQGGTLVGHIECYGSVGQLQHCLNSANASKSFVLGAYLTFSSVRKDASGSLLIAGTYKQMQASATDLILLRLDRNAEIDSAEFAAPLGYAPHDFALAGAQDQGAALALQSNRVLVAGGSLRTANTTNNDFSIVGYAMDRIFQNGFDH
jgi:uncharacterized delta-60 repeat protein